MTPLGRLRRPRALLAIPNPVTRNDLNQTQRARPWGTLLLLVPLYLFLYPLTTSDRR